MEPSGHSGSLKKYQIILLKILNQFLKHPHNELRGFTAKNLLFCPLKFKCVEENK